MELKSMISCSLQTLHSALNRRESRGCHARSDFQVSLKIKKIKKNKNKNKNC